MRKILLIAILMLSRQQLYAENQEQTSTEENVSGYETQVTDEELWNSIEILIRAGILEIKDGHLLVKKEPPSESPLDILSKCGRLKKGNTTASSICLKAECL